MNSLNTEIFIAKRMLKKTGKNNKLSQPIVFLAISGITLGICVMILSISVASGFQNEVRDKVVGFGSHIQIEPQFNNESFESSPMLVDPNLKKEIITYNKINNLQSFAYKPAIIQAKSNKKINSEGKVIRDIEGIVFKGISTDYNPSFFNKHMISGEFPDYDRLQLNDSIIISNFLSKRLELNLHDKATVFFMNKRGKPKQYNLTIAGIFDTGLEDFDKKFAFIDLNLIRKINGWGMQVFLTLKEDKTDHSYYLEASASGGNENYLYEWNNSKNKSKNNKFPLLNLTDTTIQVICSDESNNFNSDNSSSLTLPDTAWITIRNLSIKDSLNHCLGFKNISYPNDSITLFENDCIEFETLRKSAGGSYHHYVGGLEINLKTYKDLFNSTDDISKIVGPKYSTTTIIEKNQEVFNWLNMLDVNVYIIISLMILVAIINMTAALLVIILEKTRFIGILKSLGSTNWNIRKIFIYNGGYLILYGLILGNILGVSIIILQNQYGIITLPKENYFIDVVPMHFPITQFILINLCSFFICVLALVLPSYFITKISPIKAIRIE